MSVAPRATISYCQLIHILLVTTKIEQHEYVPFFINVDDPLEYDRDGFRRTRFNTASHLLQVAARIYVSQRLADTTATEGLYDVL